MESILQTAYNYNHRQIVFTIPEQLRKYFFFPFEKRINLLFKAVKKTIYSILNESYYKRKKTGKVKKYISKNKYTPGFFAFLHTFGRDLKWNPHIHILIAEIKLENNNSCIPWKFFDYDVLSLRFQKILLDLLSFELGKSFSIEKIIFIKNIRMDSMFMLNLKNFLILNLVLNMLLDIVVESLLVRIELLIMMVQMLLFLI